MIKRWVLAGLLLSAGQVIAAVNDDREVPLPPVLEAAVIRSAYTTNPDDVLIPLPAAKRGGYYDDKIHFFEQPDFVLYRLGEQRWSRMIHEQLGLDHNTELALTHRNRIETVSHLWRRGQARGARLDVPFTDAQAVQRTRLRVGRRFNDFWVLFEGQDARLYDHDFRELDGAGVEDHADVQQAFVAYKDVGHVGRGLRTDVHAGRFTFEYGGTRLLGRNVLPNGTNTFDGVHVNVGRGARWRQRVFYTLPVERSVAEPNESFSKRTLWGVIHENNRNPWYLVDLAYLGFNDKVSPLVAQKQQFGTWNLRVRRDFPRTAQLKSLKGTGVFDYEIDAAVQNGEKGPRGFTGEMLHAEAGYTFKRVWFPRASAFYDYASGTKEPGTAKNTTFDRLFGLRDFDLGSTANFGPFNRNNIRSISAKIEARPRDDIRIFYKHALRELDETKDAFVGSNLGGFAPLQDRTGRAGRKLGHDFEMSFLKRYRENHSFEVRWAHWWKGAYFDRLAVTRNSGLPPGGEKDTDFFLASYEFRM